MEAETSLKDEVLNRIWLFQEALTLREGVNLGRGTLKLTPKASPSHGRQAQKCLLGLRKGLHSGGLH